jgi:hypothetical protein
VRDLTPFERLVDRVPPRRSTVHTSPTVSTSSRLTLLLAGLAAKWLGLQQTTPPPSYTVALCRLLKEPARRHVIGLERGRIDRLRAELAELIRQHDYRIQSEPWEEEKTAPSPAVAKTAGERLAVEPGCRPA